jgi:hypothetical protein
VASIALTTADIALYLSIYATVVATLVGLWTLFSGIVRDRARITVAATESYLVPVAGRRDPLLITGEDTLEIMGVTESQRRPVMAVRVRNRGRRDARITHVSQVERGGRHHVLADVFTQTPFDLAAERTQTVVLGKDGGYQHGDLALGGWYVVDDAGRQHPLRQRYRLRISYAVRRVRRHRGRSDTGKN